MRPRFSLRWLLILFAVCGFAFYLCFVRPTVIANKFVHLVESGDFQGAESLSVEHNRRLLTEYFASEPELVEARLLDRTWRDLLKMQRRIDIRVIHTPSSVLSMMGFHLGIQIHTTAGVFGVQDTKAYAASFANKYVEEAGWKSERRQGR
jgi:hypothetical protein